MCLREVTLIGDFNVCLALSFLVLQIAVQQDDTRVLYPPLHLWMYDVLVDHDAIEDPRIFYCSTWDLLNLSVFLYINFLAASIFNSDSLYCIYGYLTGQVDPE